MKIFLHLYKGTLGEAIIRKWRTYLYNKKNNVERIKQNGIDIWERQCFNNEFEYELQDNIKLILYRDDILSKLICCDAFEWNERTFIKSILKRGEIFIDIGSNLGMYTILAADCVGTTGRVYTFEPASITFDRLIANVELNKQENVCCENLALSDKNTKLIMNVSNGGWNAWNSLTEPTMGDNYKEEMIKSLRLDDYARDKRLFGIVKVVKIDVEGWECHVLAGGREFFSHKDAPIIMIEFNKTALESAGFSYTHLYDQLETFGYRIYRYDCVMDELIPFCISEIEKFDDINVFALKQSHKIRKWYIRSRVKKPLSGLKPTVSGLLA